MIRKRIGKDIRIKWTILTNGEPLSLEGRDLALELVTAGIGRTMTFEAHGNSITTVFHGRDQQRLGKYTLTLYENLGKANASVLDSCEGFVLVSSTCQESGSASTVLDVESIDLGSGTLEIGIQGPSAYEVAVQNGFNGTEQEWLDSLKLKYADLTEDEIAQLQKPATDAAAQVKEEVKKLVAATQQQVTQIKNDAELDFDTYAQHGKKIIEAAASKAASDVQAFTEAGAGTINDTVAAAKSQINAAVQQAGTAASGAETAASEANKAAQDAQEQIEAMREANYVKAGEGVESAQKATISINGKAAEVLSGTAGELANLYAPEQAGAEGQILLAGDGKPQWADPRAAMRPVYESYGAVYNEETGYYELNGLTDITEEQMLGIYNTSMAAFNAFSTEGICQVGLRYARTIRTVLDKYHDRLAIYGATNMRFAAFAAFQQCSALETAVLGNENYALQLTGGWSSMFNGCVKLRTLKWLDFSALSGLTDGLEFYGCSKLAEVRIKGICTDLSFKDSPLIDYESWEYMVGNAKDGIGITLTVHPDTYSYLTGTATPPETVGGTSEQWQALVTAASAKGISFATAE